MVNGKPPYTERDFLLALFRSCSAQRGHEPELQAIVSLPMAISYLRELTGTTREELARGLSITYNQLTNLERRGKPVSNEQLERMMLFAQNACLYNLREYFEVQALFKRGSQRKKHEAIEDRHRG